MSKEKIEKQRHVVSAVPLHSNINRASLPDLNAAASADQF